MPFANRKKTDNDAAIEPPTLRYKGERREWTTQNLRYFASEISCNYARRVGQTAFYPLPYRPQRLPNEPACQRGFASRWRQSYPCRQRFVRQPPTPTNDNRIQSPPRSANAKGFRPDFCLQSPTPRRLSHRVERHRHLHLQDGLRASNLCFLALDTQLQGTIKRLLTARLFLLHTSFYKQKLAKEM